MGINEGCRKQSLSSSISMGTKVSKRFFLVPSGPTEKNPNDVAANSPWVHRKHWRTMFLVSHFHKNLVSYSAS